MTEPYLTPDRIDAGKAWLWWQREHDEAMYARTYIEVLENERDELRELVDALDAYFAPHFDTAPQVIVPLYQKAFGLLEKYRATNTGGE